MLTKYLQSLLDKHKLGDATEPSYYSVLEKLLADWSDKNQRSLKITSLPKRTDAGNPDFRILDKKDKLVGYIEAKDFKANLDDIENSEQLKRYRNTYYNLILTNFFKFRLYRRTELDKPCQLVKKTFIDRPFTIYELQTITTPENEEDFFNLLDQFVSFSTLKTTSAKSLAIELAKRTRFLKEQVLDEELKEEGQEGLQTLEFFYKAFKDHLICSLTVNEFSNLFAQTSTYGLFAARSRSNEEFNKQDAKRFPGIIEQTIAQESAEALKVKEEIPVKSINRLKVSHSARKIPNGFKMIMLNSSDLPNGK